MGLDYSTGFDVSVKVLLPEDCEDFYEYIEDLTEIKAEGIKTEYLTGLGSYAQKENDIVLCVRDAGVTDSNKLKSRINTFKEFLKTNNNK